MQRLTGLDATFLYMETPSAYMHVAGLMVLDPPAEEWKPDHIPGDAELLGFAASSLARQPVSAAKALRRTVQSALRLRSRNRQPDVTPAPGPFSAPRTSFNLALTPRRSYAY